MGLLYIRFLFAYANSGQKRSGCQAVGCTHCTHMVKELEWIEMAQLAVCSILFKWLSLKLP
jgi:hypothetical protein